MNTKGPFKWFQHLLQHLLNKMLVSFERTFQQCFNIASTFSFFSKMLGLVNVVWAYLFNIQNGVASNIGLRGRVHDYVNRQGNVSLLIDQYEKHSCLWNVFDKQYHDREKWQQVYKELEEVLGISAAEMKNKIAGLRSQLGQKIRANYKW